MPINISARAAILWTDYFAVSCIRARERSLDKGLASTDVGQSVFFALFGSLFYAANLSFFYVSLRTYLVSFLIKLALVL